MTSPWGHRFDSVVMLTWSNWKTEPRSNRYHYATRFARHVPVLFVQEDFASIREEPTELENIHLLHVGSNHDRYQLYPVRRALQRRGLSRPLIWIYNHCFVGLDLHFGRAPRVYHATEDYFSLWRYLDQSELERCATRQWRLNQQLDLIRFLPGVDLIVGVTPGVARSFRRQGGYSGRVIVLENGCDYAFWAAKPASTHPGVPRKVAIYQGGINERLDVPLLLDLMNRLPDWEFRFCGRVERGFRDWETLRQQRNLTYLGELRAEALRDALYDCDVGLIPYAQDPLFTQQSLPLKAFEYAACGLPVVSIPIDTLIGHTGVFRFARTAAEFAAAIVQEASSRFDPAAQEARRRAARTRDYDLRFEELSEYITALEPSRRRRPLRSFVRTGIVSLAARWYGSRVGLLQRRL